MENRGRFIKTQDKYKMWLLIISIICLVLVTSCSVLYMKYQDERGTNRLLEISYNLCKESQEYYRQQSDQYWQLYDDCQNQGESLWSDYLR